ncbi:50S ribosomal protein L24 [Myroides sp. LJL116]
MTKLKVKTGDTVRVIAGDHKGTEGKIVRVLREKNKAIVEGVNIISKHVKPSASNPQGGIVKKEAPIHISNLVVLDASNVATKIAIKNVDGKNVRVSKKSNQVL